MAAPLMLLYRLRSIDHNGEVTDRVVNITSVMLRELWSDHWQVSEGGEIVDSRGWKWLIEPKDHPVRSAASPAPPPAKKPKAKSKVASSKSKGKAAKAKAPPAAKKTKAKRAK